MKVSEFLNYFPHLEDRLIELAPAFKNLKNPMLRKTIARMTSLRQAALVGGVGIDTMINTLREAAGQTGHTVSNQQSDSGKSSPVWIINRKTSICIDARPIIQSGGHPLEQVFKESTRLEPGDILELITPFLPVPLIEKMEARGFDCWTKEEEGSFFTYFHKG